MWKCNRSDRSDVLFSLPGILYVGEIKVKSMTNETAAIIYACQNQLLNGLWIAPVSTFSGHFENNTAKSTWFHRFSQRKLWCQVHVPGEEPLSHSLLGCWECGEWCTLKTWRISHGDFPYQNDHWGMIRVVITARKKNQWPKCWDSLSQASWASNSGISGNLSRHWNQPCSRNFTKWWF